MYSFNFKKYAQLAATFNASLLLVGITFIFFCLSLSTSCRVRTSSAPKIDAGRLITNDDANTAPGVVSIGGCTASLVSPNTAISAAHCFGNAQMRNDESLAVKSCIRSTIYQNICADRVYIPSQYRRTGNGGYDIAVLVFKDTPFKHYFPVSKTAVASPTPVVFVGYSAYGLSNRSQGSKRWGRNTITGFYAEEFNSLRSPYGGNPNAVALSPGDSGGPLFTTSCEQIGVASRMGGSNYGKFSIHTNVTSPQVQAWFETLKPKNAYFCAAGENSEQCPASGMYQSADVPAEQFPCNLPQDAGLEKKKAKNFYLHLVAIDGQKDVVSVEVAIDGYAETVGVCKNIEADQCIGEDNPNLKNLEFLRSNSQRLIFRIPYSVGPSVTDFYTLVLRDEDGSLAGTRKFYLYEKK